MDTTELRRQLSCADEFDPDSLPVDSALRRIETLIEPVTGLERVAVRAALGRVLAEEVKSPIDVPAHTNSAMDGYACRTGDLPGEGTRTLELVGTAFAGRPLARSVGPGQCARIMTGAPMPAGTDTVIMQEHAEAEGTEVRIGGGHSAGQNVRAAGEDIARGAVAVAAGRRIQPSELGTIASLGLAEVWVRRRPRVAFFSTGDELRGVGEVLGEGEIYDSNRYTLYGMLTRLGVELLDMGVVRDDREDTRRAFTEAAAVADAVITSAGVSVGEADYIKDTLDELGEVAFWKLAMKPGRPLAFGRVGNAWFFGLPGNPVSVMATFYQFVQPALRRLMGQTAVAPTRFRVPTATRLRKKPGRMEFQRGILERDPDGTLQVRSTGSQGSGILSSMSRANCFIILPTDSGPVEAGMPVDVEPFEGLA